METLETLRSEFQDLVSSIEQNRGTETELKILCRVLKKPYRGIKPDPHRLSPAQRKVLLQHWAWTMAIPPHLQKTYAALVAKGFLARTKDGTDFVYTEAGAVICRKGGGRPFVVST